MRPRWPGHFGSRCEGGRLLAGLAGFAKTMTVPTWDLEDAFEDAELVDSSYEAQADARAPRTTYCAAERVRSAHETGEKVMGEVFNEEGVDPGGGKEAIATKVTLDRPIAAHSSPRRNLQNQRHKTRSSRQPPATAGRR